MSIKYASLKRLWDAGRATETTINNAVTLGWITQEEANEIMGIVEEEPVVEETPVEEETSTEEGTENENTETETPVEE